jgi:hypothetical protein
MTDTETNVSTREAEELPLPYTLPDTACGFEMIRVVEDMHDDHKIHVELAGVFDYALSWGCYLADVARAIARDYSDQFGENALAEIRRGFMKSLLVRGEHYFSVPTDQLDAVKIALETAGFRALPDEAPETPNPGAFSISA